MFLSETNFSNSQVSNAVSGVTAWCDSVFAQQIRNKPMKTSVVAEKVEIDQKTMSSGETSGGRRGKRARRHSALGGRAGDSVSGQRGRTERADCHRVQDVSCSKLGERVRSNGRGESTLPRIHWRNQEQPRSRARRRPRATRSPVRACVGGVPAQSGGDGGAGTRTRGDVEGENNVVKSAPV